MALGGMGCEPVSPQACRGCRGLGAGDKGHQAFLTGGTTPNLTFMSAPEPNEKQRHVNSRKVGGVEGQGQGRQRGGTGDCVERTTFCVSIAVKMNPNVTYS